jgi:hypothetical protein
MSSQKRKRELSDTESDVSEHEDDVINSVLMDSDEDDKYRVPVAKRKQPLSTPKPAPDKFQKLKNKVKKQKTVEDKTVAALKDLKADATRDPHLIPFQLAKVTKVDKQYRLQYQLPNSTDSKKVWYQLTNVPSLHYMSNPKLPRKKPKEFKSDEDERRWREEKKAFDDAKGKFLQQLRPEHLATIQAVDSKTGKTLATKDVLFDRMGYPVIWSQEMATTFVKNHPDLETKAQATNNAVPSTFSSLRTPHPDIQWICHVVPQIYYAKHHHPPKKTQRPPIVKKPTNNTRSLYLDLEPNQQVFVELMTVTGKLMQNCMQQRPKVITALRSAFARVRSQSEAGNNEAILTDVETQWLLLGYIIFNPTAQREYGNAIAHQPELSGGKITPTQTPTPTHRVVFPGDESASDEDGEDEEEGEQENS